MAASTAPPGWRLTYEGGKRAAINPQGQRVPYNQYLNAQARRSGFTSHSEYRKYAGQIKGFRDSSKSKEKFALGSKTLGRFKKSVLDRKRTTDRDKRPGGKLARLLEDLGLREPGAAYPVGDTPGD